MLVSNFVTATENGLNVTLLIFICQLITDFFFKGRSNRRSSFFLSGSFCVGSSVSSVFRNTFMNGSEKSLMMNKCDGYYNTDSMH